MSVTESANLNGRQKIEVEMARMRGDAVATLADTAAMAERTAQSIRETERLVLLGMGGSHWVNRTALFAYRRIGIDVSAEVLSEALIVPLVAAKRTVLLTSQSGESGEIVKYLENATPHETRFGLTLNERGALARGVPSLIAAGGMERAFAATRSIVLSHVMHLGILKALGANIDSAMTALQQPEPAIGEDIAHRLKDCSLLVFTGRAELVGVAESAALALTELSRQPALAFDGGQLRHGPLEMLSPRMGVVVLAAAGASGAHDDALIATCRRAGAPVVVFDAGGGAARGDAQVRVPPAEGYAAAMNLLPPLLRFIVDHAARLVPDVGEPLRSNKVTREL